MRPSVTARRADRSTSIARLDAEAEAFERQNSLTISGQGPHTSAQGSQAFNARRSHIFDGKTLAKETAAFQLCDIEDPMLKGMIEDAEELREVCDDRDGWYTTHALERIKMVLRHKFFSLLEGHVASDEVRTVRHSTSLPSFLGLLAFTVQSGVPHRSAEFPLSIDLVSLTDLGTDHLVRNAGLSWRSQRGTRRTRRAMLRDMASITWRRARCGQRMRRRVNSAYCPLHQAYVLVQAMRLRAILDKNAKEFQEQFRQGQSLG